MRNIIAAFALISLPTLASAQAVPGPTYVMQAGASDLYEKQSSELVMASTKDAKVRQFARDMVRDHAKSTADVKAAATAAGVKPTPPTLTSEQASNMAALKAANGTERDRLYVRQQKAAHAQALALHQSYAKSGDVPQLKATAAKIVPVVAHHAEMINAM